jgi:hypothetical protein
VLTEVNEVATRKEDQEEQREMSRDKVDPPEDDDEIDKDGDDDDDDESSDDENAHLKQLQPGGAQQCSIRRNDSFDNFMTRSQRALILGKDVPPPASVASRRKIQFSDSLEFFRAVEPVQAEVKDQYWMTNEDFDRIESEIRITQFRWENAKTGRIPFDEVNNSIRGLESIITEEKGNFDATLFNHRRSVLQEIHRQKSLHGAVRDWDKVRRASQRYSELSVRRATEMAALDELANKRAWGVAEVMDTSTIPAKGEGKKKKRQMSNSSLFFWKKK